MSTLLQAMKNITNAVVRPLNYTLGGLPNLTAAQRGTFALVNSNYYSLRCYEERTLEALLQFSCIEIAKSPQTMMQLSSLLRNPNVLNMIAEKIVTPDRVQKTSVPTLYLPRMQQTIADILAKVDPEIKGISSVYHPIVDVYTFLVCTPLAKAGMLVQGEGTYIVSMEKDLIPTWEQVKGYALAQLLRNHIEKAPVSDLIRDKQVMGRLLLQPLSHAFTALSGQILSIHERWGSFDRLGFLAAVLTLRLEDDYPEFKDLRSHPELVAFLNNHTLVHLALKRYLADVSSKATLQSGAISSSTLSNQIQGLVTTMTSTPELSVVPLGDFVKNTSVAWVGTIDRELAAVIVAPRFSVGNIKLDVSYVDRRTSRGEPALSMLPLEALEPTLGAALQPVQRMVETDAIDFYNVYADAILTDRDKQSKKDPILIGFKASETYLEHFAAALASEISYDREGEITYLFTPNVPDYNHLLNVSGASQHLRATQDAGLVIAFASTVADAEGLNVMNRAETMWKIGDQNIQSALRALPFRGYVRADGTLTEGDLLFPDKKNTLDQSDQYSYKFGDDTVSVDISFYELLMNQRSFFSSKEKNVVMAHRQPMVSAAVTEFLETVVALFDASGADAGDGIATAFADYIGDFFSNGAVTALVGGIRSLLAHQADTPALRRQRSVTLKQINVTVAAYKEVIMKLLLRTAVINRATYDLVINSDLYKSTVVNAVLRSKVVKFD